MSSHDLELITIWNTRLQDLNLTTCNVQKKILIYKLATETSAPLRSFPGYWNLRMPLLPPVDINPWGSAEIDLRLAVKIPKGYMMYIPYTQIDKHVFAMQVRNHDPELEALGMQRICLAIYNYGQEPVQLTAGENLVKMWFLECVSGDDLVVSVIEPPAGLV